MPLASFRVLSGEPAEAEDELDFVEHRPMYSERIERIRRWVN